MPRRNEPVERTCIVTRVVRPPEDMVRFVLDPDSKVVADLRHRLPGRGVWITARSSCIAEAERRHLFSRAFKERADVEPDLAGRVAAQFRNAALSALSLARKSGALLLGFVQVEAAINDNKIAALIEATDAAEDGSRKLRRTLLRVRAESSPIPVIRLLSSEEMGLALARPHVIHAALLASRASQHALDQIDALARFLTEESQDGGDLRLLTDIAEPSAEHQSV